MFVLKSYIRSAAIFGGICHPFRRALSSVVSLYNATCVHPEVLQPIAGSLLSAELDLPKAASSSFRLCEILFEVVEDNLLLVLPPGM
jgi:hypothetical protein